MLHNRHCFIPDFTGLYDEASAIIPLNLATWLRLLCKLDPVLTGDYSSTYVRVLQYFRESTGKTGFDYTTKIKLKKES